MAETVERFDPLLMAVLSRRLEAIIREMSNTVMRASRSAVITNARDMSCGILTYDHRLICVEEAMPIHVSALELTTRPITALFDDVKEGDAFFNNSPYHGVTHHADMTLCVPVFADGEPLFWVLSRSHHADVGAPEPTTYLPYAATLYQEGVHFPCVRIQEGREDKADIVRIGLQKIRAPNVWYGDYRAQVGACRIGERRLKALVAQYGIGTIRAFVEAWMDYGARRAAAAIRALPAGTWRYTCSHDPIPGVADDGIPITAEVTVEPEEGLITVDLRDNPDCVPGGVNLSEACAAGSCRIGVFYNLDPTIPHNEGSASRIRVKLRDGCVVGRPTFPAGTSVATTNVNDRLINAVQCCFAQIGAPHGLAEGGGNFSAGLGVVSGIDDRDGEAVPYVNQFCVGLSGGPGTHGHDGWLTYEAPDGGGVLVIDSIEIDEAQ
ncbi:MAG: hydantoinase B/oxoprolinase family protein, partial [Rhodospirillales bacterium]|nr:hydantoinase B/oxoprolinase family protein [Rhodospirillales bacterium]